MNCKLCREKLPDRRTYRLFCSKQHKTAYYDAIIAMNMKAKTKINTVTDIVKKEPIPAEPVIMNEQQEEDLNEIDLTRVLPKSKRILILEGQIGLLNIKQGDIVKLTINVLKRGGKLVQR